jgi:hypothetical protein
LTPRAAGAIVGAAPCGAELEEVPMSVPAATAPAASPRPLLKTPDITTAQIAAAATGAIGLAVALGVPLTHDKQLAIEAFVTSFAPFLLVVDAWIRHSRAKYVHTALVDAMNAVSAAQPLAAALTAQGNDKAQAAGLPPYIK